MHAEEVRDAQVSAGTGPAGEEHPGPAVGHIHAVRAALQDLDAGGVEALLLGCGQGHEEAECGAGQREDGGDPDRPDRGPVRDPGAPEQGGDHERAEPQHDHGVAHQCVDLGVEGRRAVEVAAHPAQDLQGDQHHFPGARDRHDRAGPPGDPAQPPPVLAQQRDHPGQGEAVGGERDRELEGLGPDRRPREHAVVDREPDGGAERPQGHHQGEHHQWAVPGAPGGRHHSYPRNEWIAALSAI